ncbi:hypothetical protein ABKN59_003043 [Abortiporus biennis]
MRLSRTSVGFTLDVQAGTNNPTSPSVGSRILFAAPEPFKRLAKTGDIFFEVELLHSPMTLSQQRSLFSVIYPLRGYDAVIQSSKYWRQSYSFREYDIRRVVCTVVCKGVLTDGQHSKSSFSRFIAGYIHLFAQIMDGHQSSHLHDCISAVLGVSLDGLLLC